MPDTGLPWSLPYPDLADEADAPKYIGQLAMATDAALDLTALPDTGWVNITVTATGWTVIVPVAARRIGRVAYMRGRLQHATYNNAAHQEYGILPASVSFPPQSVMFPLPVYGATSIVRSIQVNTGTGSIGIASSPASNNYMDIACTWVIPDSIA